MKHIESKELSNKQIEDVFHLWNREYPKLLVHKDIPSFNLFLNQLSGVHHQVIENEKQEIIAWYFEFIREDELWFGLLIDIGYQRSGIGSELIGNAKLKNSVLNGWVIEASTYEKEDGSIYESPIDFYVKNEFKPIGRDVFEENNIDVIKIRWSKP